MASAALGPYCWQPLAGGFSGASSDFSGSLNGAGQLAKVGAGKQVLNGVSSIGGGTKVEQGSLIIGGSAGSGASLSSDVEVLQGAQLTSDGVLHVDADSGMTFWAQGYGGWGENHGGRQLATLDHIPPRRMDKTSSALHQPLVGFAPQQRHLPPRRMDKASSALHQPLVGWQRRRLCTSAASPTATADG